MITTNAQRRIFLVAKRAYDIAKTHNDSEDICNKAYITAYLNNINSHINENNVKKTITYDILKDIIDSYPILSAIRDYNHPDFEISKMSLYLHIAEYTIDYDGKIISLEEKLANDRSIFGIQSTQYQNSKLIIKKLKKLAKIENLKF